MKKTFIKDVRDLTNIKQVKSVYNDTKELNDLLRKGWTLLSVASSRGITLYSLGLAN